MVRSTGNLSSNNNGQFRSWPLIRVTWGKAPPFGDDLSVTNLFASTSEKVTCM